MMTRREIIRQAIAKRCPIRARYRGAERTLCPHVLGTAASGQVHCLFFEPQREGADRREAPGREVSKGRWTCMRLDRLRGMVLASGAKWHTAAGRPTEHAIEIVEMDVERRGHQPVDLAALRWLRPQQRRPVAPEQPCATYPEYLDLLVRLAELRVARVDDEARRAERSSFFASIPNRFDEERGKEQAERIAALAAAVTSERASGRWSDQPLARLAARHGLDPTEEHLVAYLALATKTGGHFWGDFDSGRGLPATKGTRLIAVAADSRPDRLAARAFLYSDGRLRTSGLVKATGGREGSPETMSFRAASGLAREILGHGPPTKNDSQQAEEDEGLIRRIAPRFRLDDVVLGPAEREQIDLLLAPLRLGSTTPNGWPIDAIKYGRGVGLLFCGVPGTGKTLCAEAIAGELGRPLLVVQVPELMSCWVGQTQKHIAEVFRRAREEDGGAVLFFDEADSLFYSRSGASRSWQVQDVNVILTEIERHEGVVLLATNRKEALDPALARRVSAIIEFPMPDASARAAIWHRLLPADRLADDVDLEELGRAVALSGGEIKNAVLHATRLAAHRGKATLDRALLIEAAETMAQARWGEAARRRAGFGS